MLDKYFNPSPSFYKWDRFWVGLVPSLIIPFLGVVAIYLLTALNAKYNRHEDFTVNQFVGSLQSGMTFMRIASLCCMLNGFLFFFFVNKDYNNASRAVVLITMLFFIAIVIKEVV